MNGNGEITSAELRAYVFSAPRTGLGIRQDQLRLDFLAPHVVSKQRWFNQGTETEIHYFDDYEQNGE